MVAFLAAPKPFVAASASCSLRSSQFRGTALRASVAAPRRAAALVARAMIREYPDPDYIKEVIEAFPDKQVANAEEARILFTEAGYIYLDVRPELELDTVGKVKGGLNIPIMNAVSKYDPEQKKKVVTKTDNPDFIKTVEKKIPNKEASIIVACSDGRSYSMDALEALDEAGYENIVGLRGGFYNWYAKWDNNLRRRRNGEYCEDYNGDGEDSCGIHASGAGFERVDAVEKWVPPTF